VHGTILDEAGQAVPNANGVLGAESRFVVDAWGSGTVRTDAQGRFDFESRRAGDVELRFEADGFAPTPTTLRIEDDVTTHAIVLRRGVLVVGRLVNDDGAPVPDAQVRIAPIDAPRESGRPRDAYRLPAKSDADGRFELRLVPGRYLHVIPDSTDLPGFEVTAQDGQAITLVAPTKPAADDADE
jgi:hypothetical protein